MSVSAILQGDNGAVFPDISEEHST